MSLRSMEHALSVTLLTGGSDRPYVFGLSRALTACGTMLDLVASDELDEPALRQNPRIDFLKLRGSQRPDVSVFQKIARTATYYVKLVAYAATAEPRLFHILWNNRFEAFDRTLLMLYYRALGKKILLTAHNVNSRRRDRIDSVWNRMTLKVQYRLAHHIFVHTEAMKRELMDEFGVERRKASVIPFGINNSVPTTSLTTSEAKRRLGLSDCEKTILFFGRITPYKGLEHLALATAKLCQTDTNYRLLIAGRPDRCDKYWSALRKTFSEQEQNGQFRVRAEFIPDEETEIYFKAADVLVLPYRDVYQSGVLFLAHSFGLPVIAADVGSLKDDIVDGKTGYVFTPEDAADLARCIELYFRSGLYRNLDENREEIKARAADRHSWDTVAQLTVSAYASLLDHPGLPGSKRSNASLDPNASSQ